MSGDYDNAAEALAGLTGRDKSEFIPDADIPDFRTQTVTTNGLDVEGHVPIEELEALAEQWEDFIGQSWDDYSSGVNDATQSCAQELREVIDDYD